MTVVPGAAPDATSKLLITRHILYGQVRRYQQRYQHFFQGYAAPAHVPHRSWRMSSARCWVTCAKSTSARLARAMIVSSSSMYRVRIASKP